MKRAAGAAYLHRVVDAATRVGVAGELQVRVHHVVGRVIGLVRLVARLGHFLRARVRGGGLLPGAHAGEDVRRHVQRVRRRGRDARVAARGGEPLVGDGRRVVAVDEVVRDAGMVGILPEFVLEDGGRLEIRRVGLVGLRLRPGEVERVEDLRLVVGRVALGQRLVGLGARGLPLLLGARREVLVVGGDGFDVVALALGLRADAASLVDRRLCLLGALGRCALPGQRIRHEDRRDAPSGDRALGIVLEHVAEGLLSGRIPEGMQHGHGALECRLHLRIATGREASPCPAGRFANPYRAPGRGRTRREQRGMKGKQGEVSWRPPGLECAGMSSVAYCAP